MRLIHVTEDPGGRDYILSFKEFLGQDVPPYAILSHTWGDEEVSYKDFTKARAPSMAGYDKIVGCAREAKSNGIDYIWIDTCCIDKRSSAELSEAINSMYKWYQHSTVCYVYLADVTALKTDLGTSRWFTRGWTLQELIAPHDLVFYDMHWARIASRDALEYELATITGIPPAVFQGHYLGAWSVHEKMRWASARTTTRVEDLAYCLMGIFNVNMPLLYGEGGKAFQRLQRQIIFQNNGDFSILLWTLPTDEPSATMISNYLAPSPSCFRLTGLQRKLSKTPLTMSGADLQITVLVAPVRGHHNVIKAILPVHDKQNSTRENQGAQCFHSIYLMRLPVHAEANEAAQCIRVRPDWVCEPVRRDEFGTKMLETISLCSMNREDRARHVPIDSINLDVTGLRLTRFLGPLRWEGSRAINLYAKEGSGRIAGLVYCDGGDCDDGADALLVIVGLEAFGTPWCRILKCKAGMAEREYDVFSHYDYGQPAVAKVDTLEVTVRWRHAGDFFYLLVNAKRPGVTRG